MPDTLEWLQLWYLAQCDGELEHEYGVEIGTIDNPGWSIKVDLMGTSLQGKTMERVHVDYEHATDWLTCWVEDDTFQGTGGPLQLQRMIDVFRRWALH
jgi:hypothetical protein